ncbi:hypothetical protein G9A89_002517 [Geosiphon pyriformis]|nr:hypothetical protein G9A89_002517 [Geosiphon pyriformis]
MSQWQVVDQRPLLADEIGKLFSDPHFLDCEIILADGQSVFANRFVLAARSPTIYRFLTSEREFMSVYSESGAFKLSQLLGEIELPGTLLSTAFSTINNYLHTGILNLVDHRTEDLVSIVVLIQKLRLASLLEPIIARIRGLILRTSDAIYFLNQFSPLTKIESKKSNVNSNDGSKELDSIFTTLATICYDFLEGSDILATKTLTQNNAHEINISSLKFFFDRRNETKVSKMKCPNIENIGVVSEDAKVFRFIQHWLTNSIDGPFLETTKRQELLDYVDLNGVGPKVIPSGYFPLEALYGAMKIIVEKLVKTKEEADILFPVENKEVIKFKPSKTTSSSCSDSGQSTIDEPVQVENLSSDLDNLEPVTFEEPTFFDHLFEMNINPATPIEIVYEEEKSPAVDRSKEEEQSYNNSHRHHPRVNTMVLRHKMDIKKERLRKYDK